jgi:hypothetical protein
MMAAGRREWAGYPMPLEGCNLVVEPSYPRAKELMETGAKPDEVDEIASNPTFRFRNRFHSSHLRCRVLVWEVDGKVDWGIKRGGHHLGELLSTLGASDAWGIEQEGNAIDMLATLLRPRQFKQYLLTGMFMEVSKRSGVHYLFRRLRPTLAISTAKGTSKILAALCLHPIAYYEGSWAGAMCPTDDILAHLMLMRGDEHMFWRRANQHPAWVPQAGIG